MLLVALVGGYWYERPLLRTGTGYAAHNACALDHLAGRSDAQTDLPQNPLVPYLRSSAEGDVTTSSILGVLASQRAWYAEGFGCTIATSAPALGAATPVAPGANPFTTAPTPRPDAATVAALASAFGDDLPADQRSALGTRAVLIVKDGELIGERYGDGFTAETRQLGWSMAKSVTNLLVGRLVLEGKVALTNDHLRPEWTDDRAAITVDNLMRMTSGLTWDETYDLGTAITQMLYGEADMPAYVASKPLAHPVGTYQQYSSGSTNLLCSVLRTATGSGADLPRTQLFAPLGLSSAILEPDAAGNPVCSSYVWATPRDWAAIGQFALQGGQWGGEQLLPTDWMANSTKAIDVVSEEKGYAAGRWVNRQADGSLVEPSLPADAYWASGHDGQQIFVVPSADLVVVRLGFSPTLEKAQLRTVPLVASMVGS